MTTSEVKTKTEKLDGDALVWAVCKALGHSPVLAESGVAYLDDQGEWVYPRYINDTHAAALMVADWIGVERPSKGQTKPMWRAITNNKTAPDPRHYNPVASAFGETLGVAVCRALVLSRMGDVIKIPADLAKAKKDKRADGG